MFWGVVVQPGSKPTPWVPPPTGLRLHISQATLGAGAKDGARVALQLNTGEEEDTTTVLLCAFRAGASETTQLDIILSEYAEFTVEGNTAVHLSGYYMPDFDMDGGDGEDSDGEEDEELEEDAGEAWGRMMAQAGLPGGMLMDEDEEDVEFDEDEDEDEEEEEMMLGGARSGVQIEELDEEPPAPKASAKLSADQGKDKDFIPLSADGKKRGASAPGAAPAAKKTAPTAATKPTATKPGSQFGDGPPGTLGSRKFDNGMEIINLSNGRPDGKVALPGKLVGMKYVGRLKSNGKVFDASKGAPFTFRLGIGEVIKGWDVGVKGMRVGDKRKLVIPPDLGYGKKGAPGAIPPNSWLEFDVELLTVQ